MALVKIKSFGEHRKVAIWHITESLSTLRKMVSLVKEDEELLDSFKSEIKKLEWLAARITLKQTLDKMGLQYFGLRKDETGKPFLREYDKEISISHSYPYVAIIMDDHNAVGIDLEQPKEKLVRIKSKFLSNNELDFIGDNVKQLCVAWSAKEALYKIFGKKRLIFKENLVLQPFELKEEGSISGSIIVNGNIKIHKLHYEIKPDYVLVYNVEL